MPELGDNLFERTEVVTQQADGTDIAATVIVREADSAAYERRGRSYIDMGLGGVAAGSGLEHSQRG